MIAALAAMTLAIATLSLSGLVIGWEIHTSPPQALAGYGLLLAFAFTMLWVGALIGVIVRSPDAVLGIGFLLVFPLTFLSSTFVPIDGLPDGLRQIAEYNPVSSLAAATRELFGNPTAVPDVRRLAARPPGGELARLVRGAARGRCAADRAPLSRQDHRLTSGRH